jgi:hypothetical protein
MPHASVKFLPGVDQNETPALNQTGLSYTNLIRFVPDRNGVGLVQKLGGWTGYPSPSFPSQSSIVRNMWAWADTNSNNWLAIGSETNTPTSTIAVTSAAINTGYVIADLGTTTQTQWNTLAGTTGVSYIVGSYVLTAVAGSSVSGTGKVTTTTPNILSVINSGTQKFITPQTFTDTPAVSVSTTVGSSTVTITDTGPGGGGSNITNYDSVYIKIPISAGGIVINGVYACTAFDANDYTITDTNILGSSNSALYTTNAAITTTGASGTGTYATLTYSNAYVYPVDSWIYVSGVTPAGYNGFYKVVSSGTNTVTYANTTTGSQTVAGTIANNGFLPYFSTTSGSSSVTITLPNNGYSVGNSFPILVPFTIGGITFTAGNYPVQTISSTYPTDVFTINAPTSASSTASGFQNSGNAVYQYFLGFGSNAALTPYGGGTYGSGVYGLGASITPATGAPITATDWTFDNFGQILISCPAGGPIYYWDPTGGSPTATIIPQAPTTNDGIFVAMPQRQIIAWGSTSTGIQDPLLITWCDVNNISSWIPLTTNQAGSYRIPKGSKIVGCIQGPQQGLIWTDLALWSMQYISQPYIYSFNEIGTGCGLISRHAAASHNNVVYWMGQSQFYTFSGNGIQMIPCPIYDVIFQNLNRSYVNNIRIAVNSYFGEVTWYYPSTASTTGENDSYVKYNTLLGQWDFGSLGRTAWVNQSVLGAPIGASPNKYIYQHETSFDAAGVAMPASFQTGYFAMQEGDLKTFIDQVWPDMKWGYYNGETNGGATYQSPTATVQLYFYVADYPGDTPVTYGPFTLTQATEFISPRFRGRLVSIGIVNPSDSTGLGTFWRIGNMRYRFQPDGKF